MFSNVKSKEKSLEDENNVKTTALDWLHNCVLTGSKSIFPRPFMTPDQRKKLEIMKDEHLFGPYLNFIKNLDINEKI